MLQVTSYKLQVVSYELQVTSYTPISGAWLGLHVPKTL